MNGKKFRPKYTKWSEQETDILRKMYPTSPKDEIIESISERSWYQIKDKARALRIERNYPHWIESEKAFPLIETDKAYLAGLIDGEGYIGVESFYRENVRPYPQIGVANTSHKAIYRVGEILRANFRIDERGAAGRYGTKTLYHVSVRNQESVLRLAKTILPYSIIKKEQLTCAKEFVEESIRRFTMREFNSGSWVKLNKKEYNLLARIKELNT